MPLSNWHRWNLIHSLALHDALLDATGALVRPRSTVNVTEERQEEMPWTCSRMMVPSAECDARFVGGGCLGPVDGMWWLQVTLADKKLSETAQRVPVPCQRYSINSAVDSATTQFVMVYIVHWPCRPWPHYLLLYVAKSLPFKTVTFWYLLLN